MGYAVYELNGRWQGYGVPAFCDHPGCFTEIDRGMAYACCEDPNHTEHCGGFFCAEHRENYIYEDELEDMDDDELEELKLDRDDQAQGDDGIIRCRHSKVEKKEHPRWLKHIETDETWKEWRTQNKEQFHQMKALVKEPEGASDSSSK